MYGSWHVPVNSQCRSHLTSSSTRSRNSLNPTPVPTSASGPCQTHCHLVLDHIDSLSVFGGYHILGVVLCIRGVPYIRGGTVYSGGYHILGVVLCIRGVPYIRGGTVYSGGYHILGVVLCIRGVPYIRGGTVY